MIIMMEEVLEERKGPGSAVKRFVDIR